MAAKNGPHYVENVKMAGPDEYKLTYRFKSSEKQGFLRHVDQETGVPEWWTPFSQQFTFKYPQQSAEHEDRIGSAVALPASATARAASLMPLRLRLSRAADG